MFERFVATYKRINPVGVPENSAVLRAVVMATVLVGAGSIISQGYYPAQTGVAVLVGIAAGYALSWFRRGEDNWWLKLGLSFGLLLVLFQYLADLSRTLYDPRIPLAGLFLWVQVLHSFDLPTRRDLQFSLASALTLISVGGLLSLSMSFGVYVAAFAALMVASLILMHVSELGLEPSRGFLRKNPELLRLTLVTAGILAFLGAAVFVALPRLPGMKLQATPFSMPRFPIPGFAGDVINPSYPSSTPGIPGARPRFSPNAYYGFTTYVDLRTRGRLADDIVMRVKVTSPTYYRGMVFDEYTGQGWRMTRPKAEPLSTAEPPIAVPYERGSEFSPLAKDVVQTYYIEREQPNIIFSAYFPDRVYFPAMQIWVDQYRALRSPFPLPPQLVYTVISQVPAAPDKPEEYSRIGSFQGAVDARYFQLPPLPARVPALALRVTAGKSNAFEKVKAIEGYLEATYRYDLDIPPQLNTEDSVDYFLFTEKRGYCEQFAAAFVVMVRSLGIPARFVTGYAPGAYNPFTSSYEVRTSDAHGWAEVYFPGYGWVTYDPTPGFDPPAAEEPTWVGSRLAAYLSTGMGATAGVALSRLIGWSATAGVYSRTMLGWVRVLAPFAALVAGAVFVFALVRRRGEAAGTQAVRGVSAPARRATDIETYWKDVSDAVARHLRGRRKEETAREYALSLEADGLDGIDALCGLFEIARYAKEEPSNRCSREAARLSGQVSSALLVLVKRGSGTPGRGKSSGD